MVKTQLLSTRLKCFFDFCFLLNPPTVFHAMTPIKEMCCKDSFAMNNSSTAPAAILPGKMEWCGIWNLNALERGDPIGPSSFHGTTSSYFVLPFPSGGDTFVLLFSALFRHKSSISPQIGNIPQNNTIRKGRMVRLLYPPDKERPPGYISSRLIEKHSLLMHCSTCE